MSESLEIAILLGIFKQRKFSILETYDENFFRSQKTKKLWQAISTQVADIESLKNAMRNAGLRLFEIESILYTKPAEDIEKAIATLVETRTKSDITQRCYRIYEKSDTLTLNEIVNELQNALELGKTNVNTTARNLSEVAKEIRTFFQEDILNGIHTNLYQLDLVLQKIFYGRYILIGARPSVGKTALMLQIANELARQNIPVAVFSLEQTEWQILTRLISINLKINFNEAIEMLKNEFDETIAKIPHLQNIFIDATNMKSIDDAVVKIRNSLLVNGTKVWFLDYLQLIRGSSISPEQFTANVSQALKGLIKETNTIGFVLSQLNRQSETRSDLEARLADLRYSGALEQDADIVILLSKIKDDETRRKINIAKNRDGKTMSFLVEFDAEHFEFKFKRNGNHITQQEQKDEKIIENFLNRLSSLEAHLQAQTVRN